MATRGELQRQYQKHVANGTQRAFLKKHPKFAAWLAEKDAAAGQRKTYSQLEAEYLKRLAAGRGGEAFLKRHPKFAKKYAANHPEAPGGTPGETPGETPAEERPEQPTGQLPPGWIWEWNDDSGSWEAIEGEQEEEFDNDLMAYVTDLLSQYGLDTPGLLNFTRNAISQGWNQSQIMLELRKHPDYLANPLFAANVKRAKEGGGWMAEGQIIAYANETKRLAKQFGYSEPSDAYIAQNIQSGRSLAEFEHRVQIQRNVENFGPAVRMVMEDQLGIALDDKDLYELFDPELDTEEWNKAYKNALYRGRPFALGLGVRSQAEADALTLLGVNPDEAFQRYQGVAQNASRFDRLATIEKDITGNLPDDFGSHLAKADNSMLVRALVFNDSAAMAELQQQTAREIARFNTGGGVVSSQGQAIGLLSGAERATFG